MWYSVRIISSISLDSKLHFVPAETTTTKTVSSLIFTFNVTVTLTNMHNSEKKNETKKKSPMSLMLFLCKMIRAKHFFFGRVSIELYRVQRLPNRHVRIYENIGRACSCEYLEFRRFFFFVGFHVVTDRLITGNSLFIFYFLKAKSQAQFRHARRKFTIWIESTQQRRIPNPKYHQLYYYEFPEIDEYIFL